MKFILFSRPGRLGFCVFLALVCVLLYRQALDFLPRSDQWWYLADTASDRGFRDMAFSHLDLTYTRIFCKGDEIAFRPGFYFLLGLQKYLFGDHFLAWNLITLLLYITLCLTLFRLLWIIRRGPTACILALLFAVSITNFEPATWHHLDPYLVAMALVLWSFGNVLRMTRSRKLPLSGLAATVFLLTLASFIWEPSLFLALCMLVHGWRGLWNGKLRQGSLSKGSLLLLAAPAALWLASDLVWVGWMREPHPSSLASPAPESFGNHLRQMAGGAHLLQSTEVTLRLAAQWGRAWIFPEDVSLETIPIFRPRLTMEGVGAGFAGNVAGWGLLALLVTGLATGKAGKSKRQTDSPVLSLVIAMTGYLFILVTAHLHSHGEPYLFRDCSYYALMFNALLCALACRCCTFGRLRHPLASRARGLMWGWILAVVLLHIRATRDVVGRQHEGEVKIRRHLAWVGDFVEAHRKDPHFSFHVEPDLSFLIVRGYPAHPEKILWHPCSRALYPEYWQPKSSARHLVSSPVFRNERGDSSSASQKTTLPP